MQFKSKFIALLFILFTFQGFSQNQLHSNISSTDTIVKSYVDYLNRFFTGDSWHITDPLIGNDVLGLIHFIEDQPIDTIIKNIGTLPFDPTRNFVERLPEKVSDSLQVKGYFSGEMTRKRNQSIEAKILNEYAEKEVIIPSSSLENLEDSSKLVLSGDGMKLFTNNTYQLPDSLDDLDVIPDDQIKTAADFQHILHLDSIREAFVEAKRVFFNDSIIKAHRDSVLLSYRKNLIENDIELAKRKLADSIVLNNYYVLKTHNDSIVKSVNDSIASILTVLSDYANQIDTTEIGLSSISGSRSYITMADNKQMYTRIWLKNEQNDSLSVLVKNTDKKNISLVIDDGVTFKRFTQQENKIPELTNLGNNDKLKKIQNKYKIETPWNMGGNGNLGFTQTYQENWKKGGKSAISMLMVLKGFANYSDKKIKWENSAEIRNGWIKLGNSNGSENKIQKNDDKFGFASRFGISAFKKWYYSAELNFQTQFLNGYKYPDRENPISGFLAPSKTLFKIGLDYKPNKNLSIFISPITSKTVYVRDTVNIDQTNFGVERGKKRFWEPGLNADVKFKHAIDKNITYSTKYKMFVNYTNPFSKFDIDWENQLKVQFTNHINMQLMFHMLYDDNVLFTVEDDKGDAVKNPDGSIKKETRFQIKELITVGFTYKINKKVFKSRKVI